MEYSEGLAGILPIQLRAEISIYSRSSGEISRFRQAFCEGGFDQRCGDIGAERCDTVEQMM